VPILASRVWQVLEEIIHSRTLVLRAGVEVLDEAERLGDESAHREALEAFSVRTALKRQRRSNALIALIGVAFAIFLIYIAMFTEIARAPPFWSSSRRACTESSTFERAVTYHDSSSPWWERCWSLRWLRARLISTHDHCKTYGSYSRTGASFAGSY
jgi:hypothetical protein